MELQPRTTLDEDLSQVDCFPSSHGDDCTRSITLDVENGGFGFAFADGGTIPKGTPIKLHAVSGFYRRVITTGGSEEAADGHLREAIVCKPGAAKVGGSLYWHGVITDALVPGTFVDANRATKHILYV